MKIVKLTFMAVLMSMVISSVVAMEPHESQKTDENSEIVSYSNGIPPLSLLVMIMFLRSFEKYEKHFREFSSIKDGCIRVISNLITKKVEESNENNNFLADAVNAIVIHMFIYNENELKRYMSIYNENELKKFKPHQFMEYVVSHEILNLCDISICDKMNKVTLEDVENHIEGLETANEKVDVFKISDNSCMIIDLSSLNLLTISNKVVKRLLGIKKYFSILKLNNNNLMSLPQKIGSLTNLTELSLCNNKITSLPKDMSELTKLIKLDISHNSITSFPLEIVGLTKLIELDISHNKIISLPLKIENLKNLKEFFLSCNLLEQNYEPHKLVINVITSLCNLTNDCCIYLRSIKFENWQKEMLEERLNDRKIFF